MTAQRTRRRQLLRCLVAQAFLPGFLRGGDHGASIAFRRYRIDATVLLFSAPFLTRSGVGGAYLAQEQRTRADGSTLLLEFAAGSWPERAHGIRRMGLFQEVQERREDRRARATFFGFMTSSPEKNVMEARRSLTQSTFTHYVGATGSGSHGRFQCRRMEFDLPPERKWEECPGLAVDVRRRLAEPGCVAIEIDTGEAEPNTFLDSVRRAMHGAELQEATFVHNAQLYRLTARRCADASAASRLAAKRLAAHSARVEELTGTIADLTAGGSTGFRLWFDPEDPTGLPLCFEFRRAPFCAWLSNGIVLAKALLQ